jgi:hypothetical protein
MRVILANADHSSNINTSMLPLPKEELNSGKNSIDSRLNFALKYAAAASKAKKPCVICLCGSLFAASEAREALRRIDASLFGPGDWVHQCDDNEDAA